MTTGKYYTTLHKNLKNVSENFKNDGIYNVFIVQLPEALSYLYCGFDSNYVYDFLYSDSDEDSSFYEVSDDLVDGLFDVATICNAPDPEDAIAKATTYLDSKCLSLAKKAIHSFRDDKRAALMGKHC